MPSYVPLAKRRTAAVAALGLIALIGVVAVVSDVREIQLFDRMIAGDRVRNREIDAHDQRQGIIGLVQLLAFALAAFAFIRWQHRAYRNLDAVALGERRYKTGWAIGAWFVPIMNLFRPKQIANDLWRAAHGHGTRRGGILSGLLFSWWLLWYVSWGLGWLGTRIWVRETTAEELRRGTVLVAVSDALAVIAALLAIPVVIRTTKGLEARAARTTSAPPAWQEPEPVHSGETTWLPPTAAPADPLGAAPERPPFTETRPAEPGGSSAPPA